jgi:hypothetical protein
MNSLDLVQVALSVRSLLNSEKPLSKGEIKLIEKAKKQLEKTPPPWIPWEGPQERAYQILADETFYGGAAGGGKALSLDSVMPTPAGWTTMGSVQIGDFLLNEQGQPCQVLAVSETFLEHDCYEIEFDDGEKIVADGEHRWWTFTASERISELRQSEQWREQRRLVRESRASGNKSIKFREQISRRNAQNIRLGERVVGDIRTTREIYETLKVGNRINHSVPVAKSLQLPEAVLPVPPYTLGAWLGDGKTVQGKIYVDNADHYILRRIENDGFVVSKVPSDPIGWTVRDLQPALREIGVLGNKHVPAIYLRSSESQRLELLRGLMDTDGTCDDDGGAEFTSTLRVLADAVLELARTLGIKATLTEGRATLNGEDCGPKYRIKMTTTVIVFSLKRKATKQPSRVRPTQLQRYIVGCRPIASVPVRCVGIDSPSHLYLAGAGMIPTHNTDLMLGLALTAHKRALFLRRQAVQLTPAVDRIKQIVGRNGSWRGSGHGGAMTYQGRVIEFAGCEMEDDKLKFQGHPDDLKLFDEISHFTRSQYRLIIIWNRTVDTKQRCRVVVAGNPPTKPESRWVVEEWGPWLDPTFPDPALPGELRWYAVMPGENGQEDYLKWLKSGEPFINRRGETINPRSRTFIPALVQDNPALMKTNYIATLQAAPEPLRSQMLYGDFNAGVEDDAWQVIPTAWARASQQRWTEKPPEFQNKDGTFSPMPLSAIGLDVSRGGADSTIPACRRGNWYAKIKSYQGEITDSGPKAAELALREWEPGAIINVDIIGLGASAYDSLIGSIAGDDTRAINVSRVSHMKDKTGRLRLANTRAAMFWKLREALDPETGENLMLPPDPELLSDLCSIRYEPRTSGIYIEDKMKIKARIGRSPDKADAVALALWEDGRQAQVHVFDMNDAKLLEQLAATREDEDKPEEESEPPSSQPTDEDVLQAWLKGQQLGEDPTIHDGWADFR